MPRILAKMPKPLQDPRIRDPWGTLTAMGAPTPNVDALQDPWGVRAKNTTPLPEGVEGRIKTIFNKVATIADRPLSYWDLEPLESALQDFLTEAFGMSPAGHYMAALEVMKAAALLFDRAERGNQRNASYLRFICLMVMQSADDRERRVWEGELQRGW